MRDVIGDDRDHEKQHDQPYSLEEPSEYCPKHRGLRFNSHAVAIEISAATPLKAGAAALMIANHTKLLSTKPIRRHRIPPMKLVRAIFILTVAIAIALGERPRG